MHMSIDGTMTFADDTKKATIGGGDQSTTLVVPMPEREREHDREKAHRGRNAHGGRLDHSTSVWTTTQRVVDGPRAYHPSTGRNSFRPGQKSLCRGAVTVDCENGGEATATTAAPLPARHKYSARTHTTRVQTDAYKTNHT